MTKSPSSAQQAQQSNRSSDGKYTTKSHSEADVGLNFGQQRRFDGVLDDTDAKAQRFAHNLASDLKWPSELTSIEELTADETNHWGTEPGSSVRLMTMRSSADKDAHIVHIEQRVLTGEATDRTGYPKVKHEIDVQDGDDGRPVEAAFYHDDGTGSYDEIRNRVSGLLRSTSHAEKTQAQASFDDTRQYLDWPQRLTDHDQSTASSTDDDGNPVTTTTRWMEFTEGGNDEHSDHVYVEQVVEETQHSEGNTVHVQHAVSIRDSDGSVSTEKVYDSVGFDAEHRQQVRDHVEELLLDRSNDAEGNTVFGT